MISSGLFSLRSGLLTLVYIEGLGLFNVCTFVYGSGYSGLIGLGIIVIFLDCDSRCLSILAAMFNDKSLKVFIVIPRYAGKIEGYQSPCQCILLVAFCIVS